MVKRKRKTTARHDVSKDKEGGTNKTNDTTKEMENDNGVTHTNVSTRDTEGNISSTGPGWLELASRQFQVEKVGQSVISHSRGQQGIPSIVLPAAVSVAVQDEKRANESSVGPDSAITKNMEFLVRQKIQEMEENDEDRVKDFVVGTLFRTVKFIACDEMLEHVVQKMVEDGLNIPTQHQSDTWWMRYKKTVRHAMSEKRSNITSDMRRRFEKEWNTKNDNTDQDAMSQVNTKVLVAKRQPELQDIFELGAENKNGAYGYAFLHIFPSTYGWVTHKADADKILQSKTISASDEALALVLLENNYDMWTNSENGAKAVPKYTTRFLGKHDVSTEQRGSRKKGASYGGWTFAGIRRFRELLIMVLNDRKKPERKQLEKDFLQYMKDENEDETKTKKKAKCRTPVEELMMSSDMWHGLVENEDYLYEVEQNRENENRATIQDIEQQEESEDENGEVVGV